MLRKMYGMALWSLLALGVSGCATIGAPNPMVCVELDINEGKCLSAYTERVTLINDTYTYDGKTWWELKPTMVLMPWKSYAELKTFVVKVCKKKLIKCDDYITTWDRNLNKIEEMVNEKVGNND